MDQKRRLEYQKMLEYEKMYESDNEEELEAFYGLPKQVQFCRKCVISNQRPSSTVEFRNNPNEKKETIRFDEDGVCQACKYAEIKDNEIDWKDRERQLKELLDRFRSKDGSYDCIVPGSGGKDSTFTAHILKYKYGMHPLTVTWAPHIYTEIGWRNFQNWVQAGFDNILFTPNGKVHRLLTHLAFKNILHPFQPFIIGQKNLAPKMALLHKIPLIFFGENEAEYGNNIQDNFIPTRDVRFFSGERNLSKIFLGGVSAKELMEKYGLTLSDLEPYLPASLKDLQNLGVEVHYLGYYLKWDPQESYYYAAENCGFQANPERTEGTYSKYNSIDDRIDGFHYWTTFTKFGIGRATYDAAQEIRNKKITREEGVALVKKFDGEFPKKYFKEILEYMMVSEEEFWKLVNKFRSPHLWKKENGIWKLRHQVF